MSLAQILKEGGVDLFSVASRAVTCTTGILSDLIIIACISQFKTKLTRYSIIKHWAILDLIGLVLEPYKYVLLFPKFLLDNKVVLLFVDIVAHVPHIFVSILVMTLFFDNIFKKLNDEKVEKLARTLYISFACVLVLSIAFAQTRFIGYIAVAYILSSLSVVVAFFVKLFMYLGQSPLQPDNTDWEFKFVLICMYVFCLLPTTIRYITFTIDFLGVDNFLVVLEHLSPAIQLALLTFSDENFKNCLYEVCDIFLNFKRTMGRSRYE